MNVTIDSFAIQNYRSCRKTTLKLSPGLSTLIGINGSGKTNILNAILLLRKISDVQRFNFGPQMHHRDDKNANVSTLNATFVVLGKHVKYRAEIRYITRENNQEEVYFPGEHGVHFYKNN